MAMFNLIEVLPVMPGPCQLFNWEKLKNNAVTSEYFKLLMHTEKTKRSSSPYIFNRRYQTQKKIWKIMRVNWIPSLKNQKEKAGYYLI